jgi:hypothetical protein
MEKPSFHSLSTPRGEFYKPPSSCTSGYELCPNLIALVWELSYFRLRSENPDHHLHKFKQLCLRSAFAHDKDVLWWKLFPFSLKGKTEWWYTFAAGVANGSWDNLRKIFSIAFFKQNEKETIGAAWVRFSLLVKSDPVLSTLNHSLLHTSYKNLDKDSASLEGYLSIRFRLKVVKS